MTNNKVFVGSIIIGVILFCFGVFFLLYQVVRLSILLSLLLAIMATVIGGIVLMFICFKFTRDQDA